MPKPTDRHTHNKQCCPPLSKQERALQAVPHDDEPLTAAEERGLHDAVRSFAAGEPTYSLRQVMRELRAARAQRL
jgi:hypothetical protein